MQQPKRSDYTHFTAITVKWGEMDSLGHVNNTVFFRYAEDGRIAYIHEVTDGEDTQINDGPVLADLRCRFQQALRFPAKLEIGTRVSQLGRSSLTLEQCLFPRTGDCPIAIYTTVIVWFDYGAQTNMRIPETVRERIRRLEQLEPAE